VNNTYSQWIGQTVCGAIANNIRAVTTTDVQRKAIYLITWQWQRERMLP